MEALRESGLRGRWSYGSWLVAALFDQSLIGLRNAAYAPVWQERAGGALAALVAAGLIAIMAQRAARTVQRG